MGWHATHQTLGRLRGRLRAHYRRSHERTSGTPGAACGAIRRSPTRDRYDRWERHREAHAWLRSVLGEDEASFRIRRSGAEYLHGWTQAYEEPRRHAETLEPDHPGHDPDEGTTLFESRLSGDEELGVPVQERLSDRFGVGWRLIHPGVARDQRPELCECCSPSRRSCRRHEC